MSTSLVLLLVGIGCGIGFAVLGVYGQVRGGGRLRDVAWGIPVGMVVFGTAFGGLAYWLDSGNARVTLFEVVAEGSFGALAPLLAYDVLVEHPGVEHGLLVRPRLGDTGGDPEGMVELHVRLDDPLGNAIVDHTVQLAPECRRSSGCGWQSFSTVFTPTSGAAHRLAVTVLSADVPVVVHLRVTDPEKTDGERAPGF